MSTRAVFSFHEEGIKRKFHVYKHNDGYPSGASEAFLNALTYAWTLPRFEADEFAAAFIAGNKSEGGVIRISHGPQHHGDLAYHYELWQAADKTLMLNVWKMDDKKSKFFFGTLENFIAKNKSKKAA
jgi:hypothetical protein